MDVGCLLTIYSNGWKSAHAESVQLPNQSTIEILHCVLSLAVQFFGGMRRTRVDCDRARHPCVTLEGGSGSGVRRSSGNGFSGVEGLVIQLSQTHWL